MKTSSVVFALAAVLLLWTACSRSPEDGDAAPSGRGDAAAERTEQKSQAPDAVKATDNKPMEGAPMEGAPDEGEPAEALPSKVAAELEAAGAAEGPPPAEQTVTQPGSTIEAEPLGTEPRPKPAQRTPRSQERRSPFEGGGMALDDGSGEPVAMRAFKMRMDGKTMQAKKMLEMQTIFAESNEAVDLFELARTHYYLGTYNQAYMAIMDAVKLEEDNARYLYWKGLICFRTNTSKYRINHSLDRAMTDSAIAAYERALEIKPDYHEARMAFIDMLVRLRPEDGGDPEKALKLAEDLEKRDKGWGALARGYALRPGTSWEEVVALADGVLEEEPDNVGALLAKAIHLLKEKKPEEAELVVSRIYELDESRRALFLELAKICTEPEHREMGRKMIDRFLSLPGITAAEKAIAYIRITSLARAAEDEETYNTYMRMATRIDNEVWKTAQEPPSDIFRPPLEP